MRVLLIRPARVGQVGLDRTALVEPLGLEMVGACLPQHEVRILDLRVGADLGRALRAFRPEVCGLGCAFTTEARTCLELARAIKAALPDCPVIVGGPHPSLCPEDFADPAVDAIVVGEAEATVVELFAALESGQPLDAVPGLVIAGLAWQHATSPRPAIADLDQLPFPARHLVAGHARRYYMGLQRPHALVETARGCQHRCRFCAVWKFHRGRVRYKSPARVVAELEQARAPYVFFADDNFLSDVPRAHQIADLIRAAGIRKTYTFQCRADTIASHPEVLKQWRELGRLTVFIGLEKVEQAGLDEIRKRSSVGDNARAIETLKRLDIGFSANFIVPTDAAPRDFEVLREYVRRHGLHGAGFSVLTPLPGTDLYEEVRETITTKDCELFDLFHAVTPTRLPLEEFYREFAGMWATTRAVGGGKRGPRAWKLAKALLSGRVSLSSLRLGLNLPRTLSDPNVYLLGHRTAQTTRATGL